MTKTQKDMIIKIKEDSNADDYDAFMVDKFKEFYDITFKQGMYEYIEEHGFD